MALRGDNAKKTIETKTEIRVSVSFNITDPSFSTLQKKSSQTPGGGLSNYAISSILTIH